MSDEVSDESDEVSDESGAELDESTTDSTIESLLSGVSFIESVLLLSSSSV